MNDTCWQCSSKLIILFMDKEKHDIKNNKNIRLELKKIDEI